MTINVSFISNVFMTTLT